MSVWHYPEPAGPVEVTKSPVQSISSPEKLSIPQYPRDPCRPRPVIVLGSNGCELQVLFRLLFDLGVYMGDTFPRFDASRMEASCVDIVWSQLHDHALSVWPKDEHGFPSKSTVLMERRLVRFLRSISSAKSDQAARSHHRWWGLVDPASCYFLDYYAKAMPDALYIRCDRDTDDCLKAIGEEGLQIDLKSLKVLIDRQRARISRFLDEHRMRSITIASQDIATYLSMYEHPFGIVRKINNFIREFVPEPPKSSASNMLPGNSSIVETSAISNMASALPLHLIDRPVFIVACPRSGSTLLFETLRQSETLWGWKGEGYSLWDGSELLPKGRTMDSDRRDENDFSPFRRLLIGEAFLLGARNRDGGAYLQLAGSSGYPVVRFLEKTPENVLCVPFLNAIFPDALFIHLVRDGRSNVSSLIDAWRLGGTFRGLDLPADFSIRGSPDHLWRFLVPPGWQSLNGLRLEEVCATQWAVSNEIAMSDLETIDDPSRILRIKYEHIIDRPAYMVELICRFIGIDFDESLQRRTENPLPLSRSTNTIPLRDKWQKHNRKEILNVYPTIRPVMGRLGYSLD